MKTYLLIPFLLLSAFFFPFAVAEASPSREVIGVSLPLTGGAASYGNDLRAVLEFANQKFGRGKFVLDFQDDQCDGKQAVAIAQRFIQINKIRAVIGFVCSGALLSAAPIYEKANVVAMGSTTSATKLANAGQHIFHTWPLDLQGAQLLRATIAKRHSKVVAISEQTEYAQSFISDFIHSGSNDHLSVENIDYLPNTTDFRSILLRIQSMKADAILLNPQSDSGLSPIVKQLSELQLRLPLYGHVHPESKAFRETDGRLAEGIIFTALPSPDEILSTDGRALYSEFTKIYGEPKSLPHAFIVGVAGLGALLQALESDKDPATYLHTEQFSGVLPSYNFDSKGGVVGFNYVLKTLRNGQVVPWREDA